VKVQKSGEVGRRDAVGRLLAFEEMVGAYQVLQEAEAVFLLAGAQVLDRPI
jgi:hypothetical protein